MAWPTQQRSAFVKSEGELPHSAPGGKRSSIKAVAAEAGVGLGTASRALTGRGYVDETTRQRVLRAAQKLGYRPNRLAAGLRSNRSHLIALMLPDLTNEFYAVSSQVIQTRLTEAGYQLLITTSKNGAEEQETIKSLSEYHIDGIIRVPVDPLQSVSASCPVIELNRRTVDPAGVGVVSDEDARKIYDSRRTDYMKPDRREVLQIAFQSEDAAKAARAKIAGGMSFEDLAKEMKLTSGEIDLGLVSEKSLGDPIIAKAAFALPLNEVSQPVKGSLATVLLKVIKIEPG